VKIKKPKDVNSGLFPDFKFLKTWKLLLLALKNKRRADSYYILLDYHCLYKLEE